MEQVTIKDIARKCKVGVSTVSRAMNNHPDINPETKEMILKVIAESNYVPNNSARNLKRSNAKAIAILVKGMDNMFFNNMISVIEEVVSKKKYACIIERVEEKANEVDSAIARHHFPRRKLHTPARENGADPGSVRDQYDRGSFGRRKTVRERIG